LRCSVLPALLEGSHFGVSVLNETQLEVSSRFAGQCDSRFDGIAWHAAASGVPLLEGALAWFECRTNQIVPAGDHVIIIGQVEIVEMFPGKPLIYFSTQYSHLAE
jgi:flavin reductase (DIM6/NTAB) family NADH-FMN oxidoreductase RutF